MAGPLGSVTWQRFYVVTVDVSWDAEPFKPVGLSSGDGLEITGCSVMTQWGDIEAWDAELFDLVGLCLENGIDIADCSVVTLGEL